MAKAAAPAAAASREESRVWARTAAPVVAAAEEADLEAELAADEAPEADEPVVEALVLVGEAEPVRVVSVAVVVLLPLAAVPVSVELPVAVPDEELAAVEEQAMVAGRLVTPPPAQMPLATWIVAGRIEKTWVSEYPSIVR